MVHTIDEQRAVQEGNISIDNKKELYKVPRGRPNQSLFLAEEEEVVVYLIQ